MEQQQLPPEIWTHIHSYLRSPRDVANLQSTCRHLAPFSIAEWLKAIANRCKCSSPVCAALWDVRTIARSRDFARTLVAGRYDDLHIALHRKHTNDTMQAILPGVGVSLSLECGGRQLTLREVEGSMDMFVSNSAACKNVVVSHCTMLLEPSDGAIRFKTPECFPLDLVRNAELVTVLDDYEQQYELQQQCVSSADWEAFLDEPQYLLDGDGKRTLRFENGLVEYV